MSTKIKKEKSFYEKIIDNKAFFYLLPFVTLSTWMLSYGKPFVTGYYLIHYLYTYDHGFLARGFLGEVISWFTDVVSDDLISWITLFFSLCLVVSASLCIGKLLNRAKINKENFSTVAIITFVLCLLPSTFSMQFQAFHLDKILWAMTLFGVFISDRKYSVWFVPVLCALSTLINPYYVLGSMILIAVILLQRFVSSGYTLKNGILCFVTYAVIIVIALYGIGAESSTGFKDSAEMVDFYFSRYAGELSSAEYDGFVNAWLFDYFEPFDKIFELCFKYYFVEAKWGRESLLYFAFVALPFWIFMGNIWVKAIRKEDNKFQKFIYFLCLISPVVIIPVELFGWELPRYFTDNLIVELGLLLYFISRRHPAIESTLNDLRLFFDKNPIMTVLSIVYLSLIFI